MYFLFLNWAARIWSVIPTGSITDASGRPLRIKPWRDTLLECLDILLKQIDKSEVSERTATLINMIGKH